MKLTIVLKRFIISTMKDERFSGLNQMTASGSEKNPEKTVREAIQVPIERFSQVQRKMSDTKDDDRWKYEGNVRLRVEGAHDRFRRRFAIPFGDRMVRYAKWGRDICLATAFTALGLVMAGVISVPVYLGILLTLGISYSAFTSILTKRLRDIGRRTQGVAERIVEIIKRRVTK